MHSFIFLLWKEYTLFNQIPITSLLDCIKIFGVINY